MFTGIIQHQGIVSALEITPALMRLSISGEGVFFATQIGDSVAINGCCLTVVARHDNTLQFDVGPESLKCTNLGSLRAGLRVHLEPAMQLGDRLGGHLVQGHIDECARVTHTEMRGETLHLELCCSSAQHAILVPKGSVTLNGVSLTINSVSSSTFTVDLIPETLRKTLLGTLEVGALVNLEVDIVGKHLYAYAARQSMGMTR